MKSLNKIISVFETLNLQGRLKLDGNIKKMYSLVKGGAAPSDKEVAQILFPESKIANSKIYVWRLKAKLADQLISTILTSDLDEKWNSLQRGYFRVWKYYSFTRILLGLGLRSHAITLAEKYLKPSIKDNFTELAFSFSRILRDHYAKYVGDQKKYRYYKELSATYFELMHKEFFLEDLYNELVLYFPIKSSSQQIREAKKYPALVAPILKDYDYFRIHFVGHNIIVLSYQIEGDYLKVIDSCEAAIKSLQQFPEYPSLPFMFRLRQIPNYIQLKYYPEAVQAIAQCLALTGASHINWLATQKYSAILGFHMKNWGDALKVVEQVIDAQKDFPEIWHIYEAYAQILKENQDFKLGRFLNQVDKLSKEKQGMNIHVRIIEVLYYLLTEQHGKIIDMQDALREYSKRHLRKDQGTFRSDVFIRLLLLLPRYSFRLIGVEHAAKPYLKKLKDNPRDMVLQDTDLEVVPFEILWEWVLGRLG